MKDKILSLRAKGKTYNEIVGILGCSKSTVAFHCSPLVKQKGYKRNNASRIKRSNRLKQSFGGRCSSCHYDRCLEALEFHHLGDDKTDNVNSIIRNASYSEACKEAKKCALLCANCHREVHAGIRVLNQ